MNNKICRRKFIRLDFLYELAKACNEEGDMNIQVIYDEPKCFDSMMAHYGKFSGCTNYIAIVGKKNKDLDEKAGYYGEKLAIILSLGYGANQGVEHKSKPLSEVCNQTDGVPEWFEKGMEAVMLAPTAMNQQKFKFILNGDRVEAVATGGFYSKIDLGIVKYHFEAVSGHKVD
ncbi:MAG: nitroreductase family protein [Lachnospiraceae bacterium]